MKKTCISALAILFFACIIKMNFFISPASQVIAQSPLEESEDPIPAAIRKFMEREAEQARRVHSEREQHNQIERHQQQIENLHIAAKHLEAAGANDLAHEIHREAKNRESKLREHLEKSMRHRHAEQPQRETHELLHQVKNELHQLKMEVRELREMITKRPSETNE